MNRKYELTNESIPTINGNTIHRIRALRNFKDVRAGDLGGFIECERNLDHICDCWLYNNAQVYGKAWVSGNAGVFGYAWIYSDAKISGNARVLDNALIYGNSRVSMNARISGQAQVFGYAWVFDDAWVYKDTMIRGNAWVGGDAWIGGDAKLDSGIWNKTININGNKCLISITLHKKILMI